MTDGLEYLGRARLQGLMLLLVAFLVGVLAGAAGDRLWSRPRPSAPRPEAPAARQRLPRVLEEMDLTPVQRSAIDSILASGRPRNEAIMKEVLPKLLAVGDTLHMGIREVLTPSQAAEFDAYLKSHRRPELTPPPQREGEGDDRRPDVGPPREGAQDRRPGDGADRRPPPRERPDGPPGGGRPERRPPPPEGAPPPPNR
jgi:hypothetical protein